VNNAHLINVANSGDECVSQTTLHVQRPKTCSRCDKPRNRRGQRYCRACHAAYQRKHRAAQLAAVDALVSAATGMCVSGAMRTRRVAHAVELLTLAMAREGES